ncbi:MAG: stress response translation initiation inhibitor YciH [Desulfurococcaceae archaeon]|jgi:translation initiation factor 1|nr:stress response translation initiation inhibitor YciH [Desulfurococcaceae archaeon]
MSTSIRGELPEEVLEKLLVEQPLIKVRLDTRKFGKAVTVIDGLPNDKDLLKQLAKFFKVKLATGGTFREEEGRIELQGDQRQKVKQLLIEQLGVNPENIIVM